ncbi:MAG: regulation of enolase 1 [Actinomycetia bacterium]|nr:regulation of enolase 1 [Actinomycetes bacterium]
MDAEIPELPFPLRWSPDPEGWSFAEGVLTITAGPRTDLFTSPEDGTARAEAPLLLGRYPGDFQFSAEVTPAFAGSFDAGALIVREAPDRWLKLAFEISPQGTPMAVSVVTRGVSDDANGFPHDGPSLWLRVSRRGPAYALHASADGSYWHLVRHFALGGGTPDEVEVGFAAQSPVGEGCTATFSSIRFSPGTLADLRDGH